MEKRDMSDLVGKWCKAVLWSYSDEFHGLFFITTYQANKCLYPANQSYFEFSKGVWVHQDRVHVSEKGDLKAFYSNRVEIATEAEIAEWLSKILE